MSFQRTAGTTVGNIVVKQKRTITLLFGAVRIAHWDT